ncbi:DUF4232 domain-containing protein [Gulosibacter sp. ACHW.36C]|uniref:DUF4232 domain-containing protein n=1 Tax=Gulosibacter sediminis TaxID=1729695 RepID=A0ABY4N0L7_9MICO|nr:DUF4232 domain-containing protein [Gulosibacter sediminis]UQN15176.1 DUF4232 domain-containing protein [Gulosibacter sediminis]
MGKLSGMRAVVGCAAAVALLAACANTAGSRIPEVDVGESTGATDASEQSSGPYEGELPIREAATPASCDGTDQLAIGFSIVDAAAGRRYLSVEILNCSDAPVTLSEPPTFATSTLDGIDIDVDWEASPGSESAPTIEPGTAAKLELSWQSNGRCERGAQVLEVSIAGASGRIEDCLQLGNDPGWEDPAANQDTYGTDPATASWRYPTP